MGRIFNHIPGITYWNYFLVDYLYYEVEYNIRINADISAAADNRCRTADYITYILTGKI